LLKSSDLSQVLPEPWPMLTFVALADAVALNRCRQTLD
jgi:hypothetical protein